ncbi:MAG: class I SAM-dependent methyltransferase [Pseudomonadota bacterium]
MVSTLPDLTDRYDAAAPMWGDKMRALGYFDAYLGFLAHRPDVPAKGTRVVDIGAGTAAFTEAWAAIHGTAHEITLVDPSQRMLDRAALQLAKNGVEADCITSDLASLTSDKTFDVALAAHVIEHGDPISMLDQMHRLVRPNGQLWLVVSKPHWCNAIVWLQWRHKSYKPAQIRTLLESTGWQLVSEYAFPAGPPSRTSRGYICRRA